MQNVNAFYKSDNSLWAECSLIKARKLHSAHQKPINPELCNIKNINNFHIKKDIQHEIKKKNPTKLIRDTQDMHTYTIRTKKIKL